MAKAMKLGDLPIRFREQAASLERYAPRVAAAFEDAAEEVERAVSAYWMEPLDLAAAEDESGYTITHLRRLIREGTVINSGTAARPRILRRHCPRKPGHGAEDPVLAVVDARRPDEPSSAAQVARAVASGG